MIFLGTSSRCPPLRLVHGRRIYESEVKIQGKFESLAIAGYTASSTVFRICTPSLFPHLINPIHGTIFQCKAYVALTPLKLPVISLNRYFCDSDRNLIFASSGLLQILSHNVIALDDYSQQGARWWSTYLRVV